MNLDIFNSRKNNISKQEEINSRTNFISSFLQEVKKRMQTIENGTLFTIDRFEGKFAVCENRSNGKMTNIQIEKLPENVKEGTILKYENGKYVEDLKETENAKERIKNLNSRIWK